MFRYIYRIGIQETDFSPLLAGTQLEQFDHIIVGGGVVGASIAYHLTRKDAGKVLLLERNEVACAASSRAAGLILQSSTKFSKTPLAKLTVNTIPELEDELGENIGYHKVGSLRVAASDERVAELDAMVSNAADWNIPVERPSNAELEQMVPWLELNSVLHTALMPTDGYIDPYLLTMAYIKAAKNRGAIVRPFTEVLDVEMEQQKICGVTTHEGSIACGSLVDACGVWASVFSQKAGFPLPMAPVRSHYWITEPDRIYGAEHPLTILPDASAYTRPEVGGLLLGVQEPRSVTFDARELPNDPAEFSPTKGEEHWDVLAEAYENIRHFFPAIDNARFSGYVSGLSSYTPDGEIILGSVPGVEGFYAAAGDCGSGVTLSAGMGDAISDLMIGSQPGFDIHSFRPERFGQVNPFGQFFRDRCAAARASKSRKNVAS